MRRKMEETFKGQMCRENKKKLLWGYRDVEAKSHHRKESLFRAQKTPL